MLVRLGVSLEWADNQYLSTLIKLIGEYTKQGEKPEKKKVSSSDIGKFVVKGV